MKSLTKRLKQIIAITVITVFLGVGVTQALTLPTNQNVIIQYGASEEVSLAVQKLVEHNTNSKTISSTDAMLISTLQRSFGSVFIVGHGSEEGVKESSQIHSWKNVSKLASFSSGQGLFFIACNSNEAPKYIPNKFSYGFSGNVETVLAALIASFLSGSSSVTFEAIVTRLVQVFANPSKFSFLPTIDYLLNSGGSSISSSSSSSSSTTTGDTSPPPPPPSSDGSVPAGSYFSLLEFSFFAAVLLSIIFFCSLGYDILCLLLLKKYSFI